MNPSAPIINPDVRAKNIAGLTEELLLQVGEDPKREGLLRTPERVAKAWQELTAGYRVDVDKLINGALFDEPYSEMVVVRDIQFFSLCEHHLLPFFGVCHVAYLPQGKILGLSKIPKLVKAFARRLQVQERLTNEIAETLMAKVNPLGAGVVMEARHMCMEMRGAESCNSPTVTSAMVGLFRSNARTRDEFLSLIRRR
ncbi:MAG: GTP cyclohydrolase I FolE [Elusimicrobia bacterium]|nr:MAG: GTP cyclohydrolase I FolE [Elusimicrobiota bacterium]